MTDISFQLYPRWENATTISPVEDTDVFITALNWTARWTTTEGEIPTIDPYEGHPIRYGSSHGFTLKAGRTLWLTGKGEVSLVTNINTSLETVPQEIGSMTIGSTFEVA